jgi:hypothetical protein
MTRQMFGRTMSRPEGGSSFSAGLRQAGNGVGAIILAGHLVIIARAGNSLLPATPTPPATLEPRWDDRAAGEHYSFLIESAGPT